MQCARRSEAEIGARIAGGPDRVEGGRTAVSVIVPALDEDETLAAALRSVLAQDYRGALEVIVADGSQGPGMAAMVKRRFPAVRVIPNPERTASCGLNRALAAAAHPIIVRCDAQAVLPPGYISRAVETLARTGAANVGGRQHPVGATRFERAVALAMTSPLGAGDARYRLGGAEGPVDTVYLGVFRRGALEAAGGFDASLVRNQDYELNVRLRQRGETVWFDPALAADYRPRGSLGALARQYFDYGRWKRVVVRRHPASLRWRQLAAPLVLATLALSAPAAGVLAAAGGPAATAAPLIMAAPVGYLLLILGGSAWLGLRRRRPEALLTPLVLAAMHLAWGAGFLRPGAADRRAARRRRTR